ncbi:MAG: M15 family metallopeptidase, partial [Armatimonadota bacterium]|nr:M15 family metallopeptidase [Armatimonadota bacterium]
MSPDTTQLTLEHALAGLEVPTDIRISLTLVSIEYWSFEDRLRVGQLVVHQDLAAEVQEIFQEILAARFPIEKIVPLSHYGWSDDASMADNNTSAFNFRRKVGKPELSLHAYGRAIDINPRLNPYIRG